MTKTVTFLNTSEQQIYGETRLVIMWVIEKKKYILMDCVQTTFQSALGLSTSTYFICFDLCIDVRNVD